MWIALDECDREVGKRGMPFKRFAMPVATLSGMTPRPERAVDSGEIFEAG